MARRSEEVGMIEAEKAAFTKSVEIAEKAIISRGKELKEFVDQCTWSLLEELTSIKYDGLKAIGCDTDEYDSHDLVYERPKTNTTDFRSTVGAGNLHDGFDEMQEISKAPIQRTTSSIRISFEGSNLEDFLKRENIVGKIKREDKRVAVATEETEFGFHQGRMEDEEQEVTSATIEHTQTDEDERKQITLIAEEDEEGLETKMFKKKEAKAKTPKKKRPGKCQTGIENTSGLSFLMPIWVSESICLISAMDLPRVWGVTKLDDNIYVLSWMPTLIRVFEDEYPFRLQNEILIEEIQSPEDIASNDITKCLYVTDLRSKSIWEVTKQGQGTKWLSDVDWPFTLSVSSDGHLLLLRDTLNGQSSTLEIYGTNARLIKSLSLSYDIQRPLHAVKTSNGQFIIVHRWMNRESGQWVISQLTADGQLMRQFAPQTKSPEPLDWPFHLALDSKNDRLFVADYWNHRVIRCNSLQQSQTILKETIYRPLRLHYDDKKKQLIVANARRLDIYAEQ